MPDSIEDRPLREAGTMNPYQKFSTFMARLIGSVMVLGGLAGPVSMLAYRLVGRDLPSYSDERWIGSFFWAAVGLALLLLGRPIGKALGRGLE
ncbi:MAG TPA: hypothetical protein VLB76_11375 [Thermoanaerobaculia bacterium]|jgi:hypothetical protein|nr:hypothetical protein [Thermoanaerobaculia bacterium]